MTARTSDPLASPVLAADLAEYLGVDATDPLLPGVLLSATDSVIQFLGYDLEPRDWTLTLWDWPYSGTKTWPNLSPSPHSLDRVIPLPYAALISVTSVEVYGSVTTDYVSRYSALVFNAGIPRDEYKSNTDPAIVVNYRAGRDPVPEAINQAIMALAAFRYEHRGECDANESLTKSGARDMLKPWVSPCNVVVF